MALKDIRESKGWSQVTLGKRSGVTNMTISDIERGVNRNPSWEIVAKLAHALECSPHDIVSVELPEVSR
jgi:transcriptional regulator with XRE-family HTH domain